MTVPPIKPDRIPFEQMTALERRVATAMCQFNRVTRDMPREDELVRALSYARSLIREVRSYPPTA